MTVTLNNKIFTDNSQECNYDNTFVYSDETQKYLDNAKENGCTQFIHASELKNYVDLSSIQIVGITGTNGKTTTAAAIYSILLDLGYKVALQGTRGFFINDERVEEYSLTTPVQLANFYHIQKAIENGCDFFVMEVSSHAIVQKRIEGLEFSLKIHTNITQDHLDYHKDLQEYIDVKNSFFKDESRKLINKDDPKIKYNMKNGFAYGLDSPSTYKVQAYSFKNGTHIVLQYFDQIFNFSAHLYGLFNIYNINAAFAAAHILTQKSFEEIATAVENFAGVSGRMETISYDPLVIIDFAHTPDGMKKVFESFANQDIICVFGAGGDRDRSKRPMMGKAASDFCKEIIVTSDNPRFEDPDLIIEDIVAGITHKEHMTIEINRKKAIQMAIEKAKEYKNSVVLILGKGDETTQIIYDKKLPFNDKQVVLELMDVQ